MQQSIPDSAPSLLKHPDSQTPPATQRLRFSEYSNADCPNQSPWCEPVRTRRPAGRTRRRPIESSASTAHHGLISRGTVATRADRSPFSGSITCPTERQLFSEFLEGHLKNLWGINRSRSEIRIIESRLISPRLKLWPFRNVVSQPRDQTSRRSRTCIASRSLDQTEGQRFAEFHGRPESHHSRGLRSQRRWTSSNDITARALFGSVAGRQSSAACYSCAYLLQGGASIARDSAGCNEQRFLRKRTSGYEPNVLLLSSLLSGTSGIVGNRK